MELTGLIQGLGLGARRVLRPATLPPVLLALGLILLVGRFELAKSPTLAADHTLRGAAFGLALPLLALLTWERACGGGALQSSLDPWATAGRDRRALAAGLVLVVLALMALLGMLVGAAGATAAHQAGSAAWRADVVICTGVGALGGLAYGSLGALGSTLGGTGQGRTVCLVLDWLLGSTTLLIAVPWPRAHLRSLLGGPAALDLHTGVATPALVAITAIAVCTSLWRTPR